MKIYILHDNTYKVEFKDFFFSIDYDLRYCLGYISERLPLNLRLNKKFGNEIKCLEFMLKKSLIMKELVNKSEFDEIEIINSNYEDYRKSFNLNEYTYYYFNFDDGRKLFDKNLNFIVTTDYKQFTKGEISAKELIEAFTIKEED